MAGIMGKEGLSIDHSREEEQLAAGISHPLSALLASTFKPKI